MNSTFTSKWVESFGLALASVIDKQLPNQCNPKDAPDQFDNLIQ